MIIVTGATGQLGRAIVKKLAERMPTSQIGASCRDPEKAADLSALGVRVRRGDFADPESLRAAFEGAAQILIVSSNAGAQGGDPLAQHDAAIKAARAAGAKRIVYTSHMAASATSAFPPMCDHAATEKMLSGSGMAWTALRNGFYGASGIAMMGDALATGALETAQDGKFSWAAHADLAEAAAIILADEGKYEGPTPPLTGAEALDFGDLAEIASTLQDRPVHRTIITDDAMRAKIAARGAPPRAAEMVMGLYTAARNGEFAQINPALERLLGRAPISMKELISKEVARLQS
jgi:NAD(P)H dehydrogenase (quinone)